MGEYIWNVNSGSFQDASNWLFDNYPQGSTTAATAPGTNDLAYVISTGASITGVGTVSELLVGGTVTISGIIQTTSTFSGAGLQLGIAAADTLTTAQPTDLTIQSGATLAAEPQYLTISQADTVVVEGTLIDTGQFDFWLADGGQGGLQILQGGVVEVTTAQMQVGINGGSGHVVVDGAGSTLNVPSLVLGEVTVGPFPSTSTGTVVVEGGATLDAGFGLVGADAGGLLEINSGASAKFTTSLRIGGTGSVFSTPESESLDGVVPGPGTVEVDAASLGVGTNLTVGKVSGTVISDGTLSVTNAGIVQANGTLTLATARSQLDVDNTSAVEIGGTGMSAGGKVVVDSAGVVTGLGTIIAANGFVVQGAIGASGGTLELVGEVNGTGTIGIAANAILELGTTDFAPVAFNGASTLRLDVPTSFDGTINSLQVGDTIDLAGVTASNPFISGSQLEISSSAGGLTYRLGPIASAISLSAVGDDTNGTDIVVSAAVSCFVTGTRITTESGDRTVETLRVGDRVCAVFAKRTEIVWIGHRHLNCRRHPRPHDVWPVRIRAGSFGHNVPYRDLWLSPDHAIRVRDVLIPVRHLINGTSIVQVPLDEVTYYHVELPHHDLLAAEGLLVESYLDTGNRSSFGKSTGPVALYPNFLAVQWEARGCAPLVVAGPELINARQWLRKRMQRAALTKTPADEAFVAAGAVMGQM